MDGLAIAMRVLCKHNSNIPQKMLAQDVAHTSQRGKYFGCCSVSAAQCTALGMPQKLLALFLGLGVALCDEAHLSGMLQGDINGLEGLPGRPGHTCQISGFQSGAIAQLLHQPFWQNLL